MRFTMPEDKPTMTSEEPRPHNVIRFGGETSEFRWEPGKIHVVWHQPHAERSAAVQAILEKWRFIDAVDAIRSDAEDGDTPAPRVSEYRFPETADVVAIARELRDTSDVENAAPVPKAAPPRMMAADEPLVGKDDQIGPRDANGLERQWYLFRCNVLDAWSQNVSGDGVAVANIDFGYFLTHQDLTSRFSPNDSFNAYDGTTVVTAGGWTDHGTAVCGLLAADANGNGMAGIAYGAQIWAIQANDGNAPPLAGDAFASAVEWSRARSASQQLKVVINVELQTPSPICGNAEQNLALNEAIQRAVRDGIVVVLAAGNGDRDAALADNNTDYIPESGAIVVGATIFDSATNRRAPFSNYGHRVAVSAPGDQRHDLTCGITSDDCYTNFFGGTSGAAAKVAATVALMVEANPKLTPPEVRDILVRTGGHIDHEVGKPVGVFLDAGAAVRAAKAFPQGHASSRRRTP